MVEYKLQIGCLLICLYFTVSYARETMDRKVGCNRMFDGFLTIAPWAIIFDGVTAWSVNQLEKVPHTLNIVLHGAFFVSMDLLIIFLFLFFVNTTIEIKNKKTFFLFATPGLVLIVLMLIFLKDIKFIEGKTTNYSMGISVIICFVSLALHFLVILGLIIVKHRTIEKRKKVGIITYMSICFLILLAQIIFPELLMTSLLPTITIIGIYINFENPSLKRIKQTNDDMITGFATLVENRDNSTGGHIKRTKGYVKIIMNEMRKMPKYAKLMTKDYYEYVTNAAPLHDIGKVSTPDYILLKPGKLDDEEYEIMKKHAPVGGDIIKNTFEDINEPEYSQIAYEVARFHHEKWNGRGYPDGLSGTEIPLHSRIMAIADVFDAVSAKRCYRDAMPIEKCFSIIEEGAGKDFDPELVEIFLKSKDKVLAFYEKEKDKNE